MAIYFQNGAVIGCTYSVVVCAYTLPFPEGLHFLLMVLTISLAPHPY